jgi:DNA-binding transcriptional LysR family regulator
LFERTSRRVVPTAAGEAVAARARRVLAEIDGAKDEIDELRGLVRGRIAVGALLPAGKIDVSAVLARFRQAFSGIEVGLREGTAAEMLEQLEEGRLDAAFTLVAGEPPATLERLRISEEEVLVAYPPGSAPQRRSVTTADLDGSSLATPRSGSSIMAVVDVRFEADGRSYSLSVDSGDPYLIRCLVSAGFGPAMLPASVAEREGPPVETRPLQPQLTLPVYLLWRRGRHLSAAAEAFVGFVRDETGGG